MKFEDYLKGMMSGDIDKMQETMSRFTSKYELFTYSIA